MKRLAVSLLMLVALVGCTSDKKSPAGQKTVAPTASASGCSKATAKEGRQVLITKAKFDPSCIKVKVKSQFFFVNDENVLHSVITSKDSPAQFTVDLPKQTSTYAYTFTKPGRYSVSDKHGTGKATIIVF